MFAELNDLVTRELKREGSLRLAGLGVFRKRRTKTRMGRKPSSGVANQDFGADAAAVYAGEGAQGFGAGGALKGDVCTDRILHME